MSGSVMLDIFTLSMVLGLSAGFAPGPLLTLVISETLQHGISAGIKVAIAPFITDIPIILFTLLILRTLSHSSYVLAVISFLGAAFVCRLGINNLTMQPVIVSEQHMPRKSLRRGIITNVLSPHPYLFWLTVGVPIMGRAMEKSSLLVVMFLAIFYTLLVGSKIVLALAVDRSRSFLQGKLYLITMRILGLLLILLAARLVHDGINLLPKV